MLGLGFEGQDQGYINPLFAKTWVRVRVSKYIFLRFSLNTLKAKTLKLESYYCLKYHFILQHQDSLTLELRSLAQTMKNKLKFHTVCIMVVHIFLAMQCICILQPTHAVELVNYYPLATSLSFSLEVTNPSDCPVSPTVTRSIVTHDAPRCFDNMPLLAPCPDTHGNLQTSGDDGRAHASLTLLKTCSHSLMRHK